MKMRFFFIILFFYGIAYSQQIVTGKITDDNDINLGGVTIVNIRTDQKVYSNALGEFSIEASKNDELRFVRPGYERVSKRIFADGVNSQVFIILVKIPEEIEEVEVKKLSGDLTKDSRSVAKVDKGEIVQQAVGLPQPVGKMREKPAEVKKVLLPILLGQLDVQGAFDLISGKARRQKRQYKYDDLQDNILWVRKRVDDEYFTNAGIPSERISEFIEFSFVLKPQVRTYVKARNLSGVLLRLEETMPAFLKRLEKS
ncbi:peptidase associated/transthyretin-like domain-containing protein [Chryseobacterium paridis]|uniref:Carboxypeptidase regulatory-like domain-containing protein n=1 Tax=Chryseobacterium paridis TaxID=2800328 RepID=A0ABS1FPE1_9FLAO|nr:carboxypeptidase regulatory-like domain-containing protein [Chryseobacterium paridis]MBK1894226.1 carboxypeptidase regulatory-like domain-containing protein [Chryseobacterium paridis]